MVLLLVQEKGGNFYGLGIQGIVDANAANPSHNPNLGACRDTASTTSLDVQPILTRAMLFGFVFFFFGPGVHLPNQN